MKTFTVLALLLAVASATPVEIVERDPAQLEKRDTEIVYLANCVNAVSCCTPDEHYSQIIYYPKSADSQNGQVPSNNNRCTVSGNNFVAWEGAARSCTFPTSVTFTSRIDAAAQSRALYSYAGSGNNGKSWNCYKDNGRTLFNPYMPERASYCNSIYYCLPK